MTADINMACGTCFYCRHGQKLMCRDFRQLGIHIDGTYAEYVKAPYDQVHVLPDSLDLPRAARSSSRSRASSTPRRRRR